MMRYLIKWLLSAVICIYPVEAKAQILKDSAAVKILTDGMFSIYNLDFGNAEIAYQNLSRTYPGHPVLHLFNGMKIYWENFPLLSFSSERVKFEAEMRKCIDLSDNDNCPSTKYETEYLLSNICARGLLLLFYADNDLSGEVIPLATSTYRPLRNSFEHTSYCSDFYYFTGVYNYYREAYPLVYPVYKTLAFMFPRGENSIALRAEAFFMLFWIRMNFETNFNLALPYSLRLTHQYPSNPLYKICYIKNLLLLKRYDEAEKVIRETGKAEENLFYQSVLPIFNGIIQEKKYHNNDLARSNYQKGISETSVFGAYGNEFVAYGYFGLSRIGEESADNHERRMNHRKAMDLVDFKKITFDE
jgi:hypothetical protein